MKEEYLFTFGHQTPADYEAYVRAGDQDIESFGFFRVIAESEDEALVWGRELANWYTSQLFQNDGEQHWNAKWFASSIEHSPDDMLKEASQLIRPVSVGEYPRFDAVRIVFCD